jgi:DNA polymerase
VSPEDARSELATLAAALRAHAEWQRATGAVGLPRATRELDAERRAARGDAEAITTDATPTLPEDARAPSAGTGSSAAAASIDPTRDDAPRASSRGAPAAMPGTQAAPSGAARTGDEARVRLKVLATEVSTCQRCALHEHRTQTVFARGTGASGLCFVGEGPGADEDAQGYPFVGKAGQLLDRMIAAMGFDRDDVYVCNIVKCRPPKNRKPEPDEMAACRPYLQEQLDLVAPQVIVALGATAVTGLLGVSGGITRLRGEWRLYQGRIPVMPTFHPAYLLRQPSAKRDVWNDLQAVLQHMGRSVPSR